MKLHLTGDSLFARYEGCSEPMINACLRDLFSEVDIINTAQSGASSEDIMVMIDDLLTKPLADYLILNIGANDLATNKRILEKEFASNLHRILDCLLRGYRPHQIILVSPPPVDEDKQWYRHNGLVASYTAVMEQIAVQRSCSFINLYQLFMDKTKEVPLEILLEGSLDDGLHFGRPGYELLAEEIFQKIISDFKT